MEERGGKTIMCSVLFLDIVEYSKRSVSGQISLKDRFNSYLSAAISSVPIDDRIILDTGDGAAINFLGDVEDALKAALSLRDSILNEGPNQDPPLLVRAGINLGPVRLVRDINGQPNIVGDGINVAQRIMGFAEADQILVSRSYYDAVSRLSPQYTEMFSYQGSRTDKHVREHEVYAIGHLGEKTAELIATNLHEIQRQGLPERFAAFVRDSWNALALGCHNTIGHLKSRFAQADPRQRALYGVAVALPVVLVGVLALKLSHKGEAVLTEADQVQAASGIQPVPDIALTAPVAPSVERKAAKPAMASRTDAKKAAESKGEVRATGDQTKPVAPHKGAAEEPASKGWLGGITSGDGDQPQIADARISVTCDPGTQVFVDGAQKGKIVSGTLVVDVLPGKHTVIVNSVKGEIYTQGVELQSHKTVNIKPKFCDY